MVKTADNLLYATDEQTTNRRQTDGRTDGQTKGRLMLNDVMKDIITGPLIHCTQ